MKERLFQRGELWVVAQVILLVVHAVVTVMLSSAPLLFFIVLGSLICATGAAAFIAAIVQLGKNLTANPRPLEEAQLVTSGMYSIVRHPIYFSLIALGIGWAVFWQSPIGALTAFLIAVFFDRKSAREEVWLVEKYPEYQTYRLKVKKLFPWIY